MLHITIKVISRPNRTYGVIVKHELTSNGGMESWLDTFVVSGIREAENKVKEIFSELIGANIDINVVWKID